MNRVVALLLLTFVIFPFFQKDKSTIQEQQK